MKKVLVVVGIIISAVIISGIIVGLGKNEKTLFNEKIETDNNVLISIKVIESNKGWQPDKTMIISDENEHLIRYAIGFEDIFCHTFIYFNINFSDTIHFVYRHFAFLLSIISLSADLSMYYYHRYRLGRFAVPFLIPHS